MSSSIVLCDVELRAHSLLWICHLREADVAIHFGSSGHISAANATHIHIFQRLTGQRARSAVRKYDTIHAAGMGFACMTGRSPFGSPPTVESRTRRSIDDASMLWLVASSSIFDTLPNSGVCSAIDDRLLSGGRLVRGMAKEAIRPRRSVLVFPRLSRERVAWLWGVASTLD